MGLQRSSNRNIDIFMTGVDRLQITYTFLRYQIKETLPTVSSWKSAELSEIVVAGQTMISVSLNINCPKISTERTIASEQEVLDLWVKVEIGQLFGLSGQSSGQWVVVIVHFDDRWSIEPVTQTQWSNAWSKLRDKTKKIKFIIGLKI